MVSKKLMVGLGVASAFSLAALLYWTRRGGTKVEETAPMSIAGSFGSSILAPIQSAPSQAVPLIQQLITPLTENILAKDLQMSFLKPDTAFVGRFKNSNILTSDAFTQKLSLAIQDRESIEERNRVLNGTFNVTPSTKGTDGLTDFERRVRSSPNFVGSKYT